MGRQSRLRKEMYGLLDQFGRRLVRITGRVIFDRAISFVVMLFQDRKGARQVYVYEFALFVGFIFFHVADSISASEHGVDGAIGIVFVMRRQGITEIRQRSQPRAIHFVDDLHDEEMGLR